jgi:hypothetical protein
MPVENECNDDRNRYDSVLDNDVNRILLDDSTSNLTNVRRTTAKDNQTKNASET